MSHGKSIVFMKLCEDFGIGFQIVNSDVNTSGFFRTFEFWKLSNPETKETYTFSTAHDNLWETLIDFVIERRYSIYQQTVFTKEIKYA